MATGNLLIELGGLTPGVEYDQLQVTGAVALDGALTVELINGFLPQPGDQFQILTYGSREGAFQTLTGLDLGNGLALMLTYTSDGLNLVAQSVTSEPGPKLDPIGTQNLPTHQDKLEIDVTVRSHEPGEPTLGHEAGTLARVLDQVFELEFRGSLYENWGGQQERWLQGANSQWYFIKPTGELYAWDGRNSATGTLFTQLDPLFYNQIELLHDSKPNQFEASFLNGKLHIQVAEDFFGNFYVEAEVGDGASFGRLRFLVTRKATLTP